MWDEEPRLSLDVGLIPVSPTWSACGQNRANSSTSFPQNPGFYLHRQIFGNTVSNRPYMGVSLGLQIGYLLDLSTGSVTYPQITAGYPQNGCLNNHS